MKTLLGETSHEVDVRVLDDWFQAEREARDAYAHWTRLRDRESYAVYRACADRADAAQDELAQWGASLCGA